MVRIGDSPLIKRILCVFHVLDQWGGGGGGNSLTFVRGRQIPTTFYGDYILFPCCSKFCAMNTNTLHSKVIVSQNRTWSTLPLILKLLHTYVLEDELMQLL